jgi:RNA polymerase sigma factor (sigma-70 family)
MQPRGGQEFHDFRSAVSSGWPRHYTDAVMTDGNQFRALIQRVREGDAAAASECVRLYEPEIRRAARIRLTDPRLRRLVDSVDICQSVFGRFFVHAANGSLDMERPEQLLALLVAMTRNRVTDMAREQTAQKRDVRRQLDLSSGIQKLADRSPGPGSVAAAAELLSRVREHLTPEERRLVECRNAGLTWQQIAEERNGTAAALRKQLERALERVRTELGIQ